jgi:type IV pilus assembly protein PilN
VALQRVTQRAHEVELSATAPDSHAAATWLQSLESASGVRGVEIVEIRRQAVSAPSAKAGKPMPVDRPAMYDFIALVRWTQAPVVSGLQVKPVTRSTR